MPCKVLYCIASTKFMHNMQKKPAECAEQCKKKEHESERVKQLHKKHCKRFQYFLNFQVLCYKMFEISNT